MNNSFLKFFLMITVITSCSSTPSNQTAEIQTIKPSENFNTYWYNGDAEITSYQLEQARYGEIHTGTAVMIFVTEPFNMNKQVKSDNDGKDVESVLKLNFTKKFTTGIYPYSMMTSTFLPLSDLNQPLEKITSSVQEWCGQVYMQINRKNDKLDVNSYSYFESEGDQQLELHLNTLEDELWSKIRTNPDLLPIGKQQIIPSLFYLRLMHQPLMAYDAEITKTNEKELVKYAIHYPKLDRKLIIFYENNFPHSIIKWEETYQSGWGEKAANLTTKATKMKTLKIPYWQKNSKSNAALRDSLGLN